MPGNHSPLVSLMKIIHQSDVPTEHRISPKGTFELHRQHISLALGGIKDVGPWGGGHPFDVELTRIPAGKRGYPYHSHAAQTEQYVILAGSGRVRDGAGEWHAIRAGDHFIAGPGEAHQIHNDSDADLVYLVIADHHRADITTYPGTDKRQAKPEYRVFRMEPADYYEGEE